MESQGFTQEMTFRDYLRVIFRQKNVIILCFLVVVSTVFVGLTLKTPMYRAQVKMLISGEKLVEAPYYQELGAGQRSVHVSLTQSEVVTSSPVLERAVAALSLDAKPIDYEKAFASPLRNHFIDIEVAKVKTALARLSREEQESMLYRRAVNELRKNVQVTPIRDTNIFVIAVTDFDPLGAAIIANVVSRSYVIFDLQQQLAELELKYGSKHPTVLQLKDNVMAMIQNLNGQPLSDEEAIGPASVKIIEQALVPMGSMGPKKTVTMGIAAMMGIFLGLILAFIFEYMDQTVKAPFELETKLGLAHLGSIPFLRFRGKTLLKDVRNLKLTRPYPRAIAALADQVRLLTSTQSARTILFVEPEPNGGIAGIVCDLGFCLSGFSDKKILIVDANYRKPTGKASGKRPGLVDVLTGEVTLDQAVEEVSPRLWMLASGETTFNPMTFLDIPAAKEFFQQVKTRFDYVLIQGPDLKSCKDSLALAANVDGIVLVVSEGKTRIPVVQWAIKPMRQRKYHVLGAILNSRKFVIPRFIYDRV